ncbi:MAG TPA: dTDP-4-dehydrorhamnose reductase [Leptospiraceae bacterium]|nr:dTDP-4-dehydrorhamnose reductase [Leptospiraceae bacterium]HMW07525.1 dTDP-4-dehydrorhamnose reductase [Leptospiraceae bacterium]HMX33297.1 dTDP-4-dehydrorhamnose reductase [Leptospiraceae bacterium]HMY33174.1 dTDP-4-dehydrorhamnose reductase [Leptospiraceae bacterium]HNA09695.1 dTDP-4-dehydrorhamnose reductase [Leptospiraceae bacterium]
MELTNKHFLITGGKGMLATDLQKALEKENCKITAIDVDELDILVEKDVHGKIAALKPDILINCAAYTAVDKCETESIAYEINGTALKYLSEACANNKIKLVHFSTDYIFSGNFKTPIPEDQAPAPINQYGHGKLRGEENILKTEGLNFLLLRVQWLYGKNGKNFIDTMLKLSKEKSELNVVNDQIGRPTSTPYLSELIVACLKKDLTGIYHLGPSDYCSWYDLASYVLRDTNCKVKPIPSSAYPTPAKRPLYSVLGLEKIQTALKGSPLIKKTWKELADEYLSQ